jgi:hypothetical protein
MNKTVVISITAVVVSIILGGSYYLVQKNNEKLERDKGTASLLAEQAKIKYREEKLDKCLADAEDNYRENWDRNVKTSGSTDGTLPSDMATDINNHRESEKEDCFSRYN